MRKKIKEAFFIFMLIGLALATFTGCASLTGENCPYVINNPRIELGEREDVCKYMGAYFDFFNSTEKIVTSFSVSFLIYDEDGKSPVLGSNKITADFFVQVPPNEDFEIVLSMDKYLTTIPDSPYQMDYFYVQKIGYSDGSVWEDPFGMYARSVIDEED